MGSISAKAKSSFFLPPPPTTGPLLDSLETQGCSRMSPMLSKPSLCQNKVRITRVMPLPAKSFLEGQVTFMKYQSLRVIPLNATCSL